MVKMYCKLTRHGCYFYHSVRDGSSVRTVYLGSSPKSVAERLSSLWNREVSVEEAEKECVEALKRAVRRLKWKGMSYASRKLYVRRIVACVGRESAFRILDEISVLKRRGWRNTEILRQKIRELIVKELGHTEFKIGGPEIREEDPLTWRAYFTVILKKGLFRKERWLYTLKFDRTDLEIVKSSKTKL